MQQLNEMGFTDTEHNERLLRQHEFNVMRVVQDLLGQ